MRVLILGGTGAMGVHLAQILQDRKDLEVLITSRKKRQNVGNIKYIQGDAHDDAFFDSLLAQKFDVIVDFMVYNTSEFSARATQILKNCAQYIFLSTSRVYADSQTPITESSARLLDVCKDEQYLATDEYALTKARQENILFDSGRKNFTIIRPYITYAHNRLQLGILEKESWLSRALCGKAVVFSSDIFERKTTLSFGRDVSLGICALIAQQRAFGEVFHITQSKALLWREIWEIYKPVIENFTQQVARLELVDLPTFHALLPFNKYQINYDRLYHRVFDNSKIVQFVDISSFTAPEVGLKLSLEKFLQQYKSGEQKFLYADWAFMGAADRISGDWSWIWSIRGGRLFGAKSKIKYYLKRFGVDYSKWR